ncbi:hypothetical protein WwAna0573, partial [Wolbachia endosymbiont of Drosophila ananassae]
MALRSKLLDEKVVESAKEMLKKVRNMHMFQKTKCCNCSKKVQYNGCSKNILHFKKRTN